jgi:hypothetical protein
MDPSAFSKSVARTHGARARDMRLPPNAAPYEQGKVVTDPADLVARALAILAEDSFTNDESRSPSRADIAAPLRPPSVGLPLERRILSDGTECSLPIRYFDVQCLVATFLTEFGRAAELLRGTGLKAVAQEDGKAVVALYCIEYRKTDIGPYNEVGLTVLALAPGDPVPANYVVDLPVTTAVANRAGREIWGYNKFVAAIDVKSVGKKFSTFLRDSENEMIGALEGERGASVPAPAADILTFTLLRGRLIKTTIQVLTPFQASSGDGFVFQAGISKHPMTSRLQTLRLDGARPVVVQYADPFQSLLFPGRAL